MQTAGAARAPGSVEASRGDSLWEAMSPSQLPSLGRGKPVSPTVQVSITHSVAEAPRWRNGQAFLNAKAVFQDGQIETPRGDARHYVKTERYNYMKHLMKAFDGAGSVCINADGGNVGSKNILGLMGWHCASRFGVVLCPQVYYF